MATNFSITNDKYHGNPSDIDTTEWLNANNLHNLVSQFVARQVSMAELLKMDTEQINAFLKQFTISGTDKIRLRSKLHHLRMMRQHSKHSLNLSQSESVDEKSDTISLLAFHETPDGEYESTVHSPTVSELYAAASSPTSTSASTRSSNIAQPPTAYLPQQTSRRLGSVASFFSNDTKSPYYRHYKGYQSMDITAMNKQSSRFGAVLEHSNSATPQLSYPAEPSLERLVDHQQRLQAQIHVHMDKSNRFMRSAESSLSLIENEFNFIVNEIQKKKNEMIKVINSIKMQQLENLNQYIRMLKHYQFEATNTMNECLQLFANRSSDAYKIKTMVENVVSNQDISSNLHKFHDTLNVKFHYKAQFPSFLSSICSLENSITRTQHVQHSKHTLHSNEHSNNDVGHSIRRISAIQKHKNKESKHKMNPYVNSLEVMDIEQESVSIQWRAGLANSNESDIQSFGMHIDLKIIDTEQKQKPTVLQKRIEMDENNSGYQINISGLYCNHQYQVELNINNKYNQQCITAQVCAFKTKATPGSLGFNVPSNVKAGDSNSRFLITDNGKKLRLISHDSGTICFGDYLQCSESSTWTVHSVTFKLLNVSPSGFGIGFACEKFTDFDGWNTGENGSLILYGNSEFYTSTEFIVENEQYDEKKNGTKLFQFDFFRSNNIVQCEINRQSKKLFIHNKTTDKRIELNLNETALQTIVTIVWLGWSAQSIQVIKQQFE